MRIMNKNIQKPTALPRKIVRLFTKYWLCIWYLVFLPTVIQQKRSFLGFFWTLFAPVMITIGMAFAANLNIINTDKDLFSYTLYVIIGTSLWQLFRDAISAPENTFQSFKSLLSKMKFPHEIALASKVIELLLNFGLRLIIILPFFLLAKTTMHFSLLLLPIVIILLFLGLTLGCFIAPISIISTDFGKVINALLMLVFLGTPILYTSDQLPQNVQGFYRFFPVSFLLQSARNALLGNPLPDPSFIYWLLLTVSTFGLYYIGIKFYLKSLPIIIERIS